MLRRRLCTCDPIPNDISDQTLLSGDPTPIHTGSDEGGEYVAINQKFDTCTGVWYSPGEKTYIGPMPCLSTVLCL